MSRSAVSGRSTALLIAVLLAGCVHQPPAPPPAPELRLYAHGDGELYVAGPGASYLRAAFLYVLEERPVVRNSISRRSIGVVRGVDGRDGALRAVWSCRLSGGAALPPAGLPVEVLRQDSQIRQGHCWGRYLPAEPADAWPPGATVDLELNLGLADGVKAGDRYEVLQVGAPDPGTQHGVQHFQPIGVCQVQVRALGEFKSLCRMPLSLAKEFDRDAWTRGGFIHLLQPEGN